MFLMAQCCDSGHCAKISCGHLYLLSLSFSGQPLQTLSICWRPMHRLLRPFQQRGRTEIRKSSPNQKGWKWRRKRKANQQSWTITLPGTELEKKGLVNRLMTSSPSSGNGPLLSCIHWAKLLNYTIHPLGSHPVLLTPLHPTWLSSHLRCQKEKRYGKTPMDWSMTCQPPCQPLLPFLPIQRPWNMMQTKLKS